MSESGKAVLAVGFIGFAIASLFCWMLADGNPDWAWAIGLPLAALGCLAWLLWGHFRKDRAPDFLRQSFGRYFERDGFCFAITCSTEGIRAFLDLYYQNRYSRPSQARVVVRPSRGFWLNRPEGGVVGVDIACDGGAFGVIRVPWGIPESFQGKTASMDVAAAVRYPQGKGRMLRFQDGLNVGKTSLSGWTVALTVAGLLGGKIVMSKPAQVRLAFPAVAATEPAGDAPILHEVLWRPDDPDVLPSQAPDHPSTRLSQGGV
jgi:hypothetical protein